MAAAPARTALLLLSAAAAGAAAAAPLIVNGSASGVRYDGHSALSAGASSRLLRDYEARARSCV